MKMETTRRDNRACRRQDAAVTRGLKESMDYSLEMKNVKIRMLESELQFSNALVRTLSKQLEGAISKSQCKICKFVGQGHKSFCPESMD